MLSEQVQDQDHGACIFNGEQVNDHIEQDDHDDNVIEDDGTNTLIHYSFNVRINDDDCNTPVLTPLALNYIGYICCK